jgi:hypothetical protein
MADKTIAALTDGATAHLTDKIYASRDPFDASGDVWICPQYIRDMLRGSEHTWTKTQTIALGTITDPANILALSATWNDAADTFAGIDLNVTDTASGVSSMLMNLRVGGASVMRVSKGGGVTAASSLQTLGGSIFITNNSGAIYWGASNDTLLSRDAANTVAQRNGVNAQTFRVYNTFTDASNYERLDIAWSSNTASILTIQAGTGSARSLQLGTTGSNSVNITTNNTGRWSINASGNFLAQTDNTYDIGASGANRPRYIYVGLNVVAGGSLVASASGSLLFTGRTQLAASAAGLLMLANAAGTDFARLQFGGTTSSFPSLKRDSAALQVRLADDSAYATIQGALQTDANAVAETPTATHTLTIKDASGTAYKVLAVAA